MKSARILVVEDEVIIAADFQDQLEGLGYEVVGIADTGEEAIRLAGSLEPDLVLMDIRLRGEMDGITAASHIRQEYQLPVLYLTAYSDDTTLARAKLTEPLGYINKPCQERDLRTAVEVALYKHKADRRLQDSEQRYRTTLNSVGDGIIAIDPQGRVTLLNPVAEQITGWKQAEAAGLPFEQIFPLVNGLDGRALPNPAMQALGEKTTIRMGPHSKLVSRDGREVAVEDTAAPILLDGQQEPTGAVLAFRDVTEQRRTEEALRQAQKLESMGLLAGGIAHDFNNLLTPVLGYAELLMRRLQGDPIAREMADAIGAATRKAAQLTMQMLAYAGKGLFVIKPLDLSLLVSEMAALLSASVSKKVELQHDLAQDLPAIEADAAQISQVVMNLITNASESYGESAGVVQIRTRLVHADTAELASPFIARTPPAGQYVVLEVSDKGCGISAETLHQIFDPFFTTKFTGRGLGLAAVVGIVRGHQGTLKVRSALGQGTTFEVFFPRSDLETALSRPPSVPGGPLKGGVLVVDDDEAIRRMTERILNGAGLVTISAKDGWEAVEVFQERKLEIDLVVLDLLMPRMNGIEVCRELNRLAPAVPVILMSGYSPESIAKQFAGMKLAGIIQKPFQPAQLVDLIRAALEQPTRPLT